MAVSEASEIRLVAQWVTVTRSPPAGTGSAGGMAALDQRNAAAIEPVGRHGASHGGSVVHAAHRFGEEGARPGQRVLVDERVGARVDATVTGPDAQRHAGGDDHVAHVQRTQDRAFAPQQTIVFEQAVGHVAFARTGQVVGIAAGLERIEAVDVLDAEDHAPAQPDGREGRVIVDVPPGQERGFPERPRLAGERREHIRPAVVEVRAGRRVEEGGIRPEVEQDDDGRDRKRSACGGPPAPPENT